MPSMKRMFSAGVKPRGGSVGTPVVKIRTSPKFRLYDVSQYFPVNL